MAEYIEREALIESIRNGAGTSMQKLFAECCVRACDTIADVVPRAEFAVRSFQDAATIRHLHEEIFELKKELGVLKILNENMPQFHKGALQVVAKEILDEIYTVADEPGTAGGYLYGVRAKVVELRKKYLGETQNEN